MKILTLEVQHLVQDLVQTIHHRMIWMCDSTKSVTMTW